MKICLYNITTTIKNGGIETVIRMIAKQFLKQGHQVIILGGKDKNFTPPLQEICQTVKYKNRSQFTYFGSRFSKLYERLSIRKRALKILADFKPDIVHIFKPYDLIVAPEFKQLGAKVVFTSGGTDFFFGDKFFKKYIDAWTSCSNFNAKQIENHYQIKPQVIYNGVDTQQQPLIHSTNLNIPKNTPVLLAIGRLVGLKGHHYLIKSLQKLHSKNKKYHLIIIGDGPEKKTLLQLVHKLNLNPYIHFTGDIAHQDIANYFAIASVFIQPSIADETFGITIAEAMAAKIPVIGTSIGGIPEVIKDAGILIPPKDETAIANAIETICTDSSYAKLLQDAGLKRAINTFEWELIAQKYLKLFTNICDKQN